MRKVLPTSSDQTTQGTVGSPAVIVPAATAGSSAFAVGLWLSAQRFSVALEVRHGPAPDTEVSSGRGAAVPLPTASHWKPPSTTPETAPAVTALAAKTRSFLTPKDPGPCSYQTTHGTVSPGPVKAMSGSIPLRLGSTLRDGSPAERSTPTCCQQKPPTGLPPAGFVPAGHVTVPGPIGLTTKI